MVLGRRDIVAEGLPETFLLLEELLRIPGAGGLQPLVPDRGEVHLVETPGRVGEELEHPLGHAAADLGGGIGGQDRVVIADADREGHLRAGLGEHGHGLLVEGDPGFPDIAILSE